MGEKRDEWVNEIGQKLEEWNERIDGLEEAAGGASDEVRVEIEQQLARLRDEWSHAKSELERLRDAGEGASQSLQQGLKDAVDTFRATFEESESYAGKNLEGWGKLGSMHIRRS